MLKPIKTHPLGRAVLVLVVTGVFLQHSGEALAVENNFGPKNHSDSAYLKEIQIPPAAGVYPIGEKLVYEINWMGVPIGEGKLELSGANGGPGGLYSAEATASGNDFLNSFFPVEDRLSSKITAEGHSSEFTKNVREGKYRAHETVTFDAGEGRAKYRSLTSGSEKEFTVGGRTHDVLSAFYWVRQQPMKTGDEFALSVFNDEKNWDLVFKVKGVKRIRVPGLESQDAVVLVPEARVDGKTVGRGKVVIYVSNDAKRIPLLVQLNTPFGPVTSALKMR